jgi:hypothetical protein
MPLLKRKRVLAASIESTSGTIETLDAADAAINAFDVMPQASIEFIPRPSQGSFSSLPGTLGAYGGSLSFKTEITGDGAGGVPDWASTFLPACGWVDSTGTFSPATEAPGSNVKTVTLGIYEDGMLKRLRGAVGSFKLMFTSGKIGIIEWNFMGVWQAPTDATILAPTYPTDLPMRFANTTFTLGGSSPGCVETLEIDAGNSMALRPCPGNSDGSGYSAGIVLDRRVVGSMNPESQLVASNDHFGKWLSGTEEALSMVFDDGTDEITIAAPKVQRTNIQEGDRGGLQVDQIEFQCNKSAAAGNDELTIAFGASPP